jgi:hypothetical protein
MSIPSTGLSDWDRITVTFQKAKDLSGLGLTTLWRLAKEKRLELVYVDGRTLIWFPSLLRLLTPPDILAELGGGGSEPASREEIRRAADNAPSAKTRPQKRTSTEGAQPERRRRRRPPKVRTDAEMAP